jgi:hypothetical protein
MSGYPEFAHIGFKAICAFFMWETMNYQRQRLAYLQNKQMMRIATPRNLGTLQ